MAVAAPRPTAAPPRRRRTTTSRQAPRRATARPRARQRKASLSGGIASLRNLVLVLIAGVVLSPMIFLHVSALNASMAAGERQTELRATEASIANVQAEIEQRLADGRVERAAAAYGMVMVPPEAVRTLRVTVPAGKARP